MYESKTVIAAYRAVFAMLYDLRIDVPPTQLEEWSFVIPAIVDFADAYALFPALEGKIFKQIVDTEHGMTELIAHNPFRFLKVACKLQSPTIYKEATAHAVAMYDTLHLSYETCARCMGVYFADTDEAELHDRFHTHAREFHEKLHRLERGLIRIDPEDLPDDLELGDDDLRIGQAIWREWVLRDTTSFPAADHDAFSALLHNDFDVAEKVADWGGNICARISVDTDDIHRATEVYFKKGKILLGITQLRHVLIILNNF